jgi:5'-3' exonuclease
MILLDYSQTVIGSFMAVGRGNPVVEEDLLRHTILNSIRMFRNQFAKDYGEMVICCDDKNNWRKEVFPEYKANRRKNRENDITDWKTLFELLHEMREDLNKYFPYKVMHIDSAEADDIIGVLVEERQGMECSPTLILSSDKDFIQLQKFDKVKQWSPLQKKFIVGDPAESLYDKTIRGDTGDGVPNILSSDDTLITEGKRQTPVTKKKMELWRGKKPEEFCNEAMLRNYHRNKTMVDLRETPESIRINIVNQYDNQEAGDRSQLLNYFVDKRLKNLMEVIDEF